MVQQVGDPIPRTNPQPKDNNDEHARKDSRFSSSRCIDARSGSWDQRLHSMARDASLELHRDLDVSPRAPDRFLGGLGSDVPDWPDLGTVPQYDHHFFEVIRTQH